MLRLKNLKPSALVISNGLYWRYSYEYYLKSMDRLGVKNIELHGNASHFPIECISMKALEQLRANIRSHGLKVITMAHDSSYSYPNIAAENKAAREKTIGIYKKLIMAAEYLECRQIQLLPGRGGYDLPVEETRKRAADSLVQICEEGEKRGVDVILEHTSPHNTNAANTCSEVLDMINRVGKSNLVGMLDFCSVAKAGDDFAESYFALGKRMRYIHACDGTPMGHLLPGEGNLDFDGILKFLDDQNYSGYISYEIYHDNYTNDPELYIKRALDYIYERMGV